MKFSDIPNEIKDEKSVVKKVGMTAAVVFSGTAPIIATGYAIEKKDIIANGIQKRLFSPVNVNMIEAEDFKFPKIINIIDKTSFQDKEIYREAIGGIRKVGKLEVLSLFDDSTKESKIKFLPSPMSDAVYLKDAYEKNQYINIDHVYEQYQLHKLAELRHIAFELGARAYSIELSDEITEESKILEQASADANIKIVKAGLNEKYSHSAKNKISDYAIASAEFVEKRVAKKPKLKIFKNDENILELINQVLSAKGEMKSTDIILEGSRYAFISSSSAAKINATIKKLGASLKEDFEKQTERESHKKLIFHIEF